MRLPVVFAFLAAAAFVGGCGSNFYLARSSPLPQGLRGDAEAVATAGRASHLVLRLREKGPAELAFYCGPVAPVLVRQADGRATVVGEDLVVRFNAKPSTFRHFAPPNVMVVAEE